MPRRITVPDEHIALILPSQLADDLMNFLTIERQRFRRKGSSMSYLMGEVMLALLEAREA